MSQSCGIYISTADNSFFCCETAASFGGNLWAEMKLPSSTKSFS